jgi:integrase/recombinase XerD
VQNLPRSVRYVKQLATRKSLDDYLSSLENDYAPKTIETRMGVVFSLLKSNKAETGVDEPSTLVKLKAVESNRPKAYSKDETSKLFSTMSSEEYLRYTFFMHTGCREQEVMYATWADVDLTKSTFRVTGRDKGDVNFVTKNHEERTVPLTTELVTLLKARAKNKPTPRWIFANEDGDPEGHFLRKFKAIAKRAGLNCGQCQTSIREGQYDNRRDVSVTCETRPVCNKHYLHRLRKTAATRWLRDGKIDLMRIKTWLGHKTLAVTQIYLSDEPVDGEQAMIDKAHAA